MAHVAQYKKDIVKEFTDLVDAYPIIGVVNMQNLPTKQLQNMRERLREKVVLKMTKKRLMKIILEKSKKKDIKKLEEHLKGMPAFLFTKENPFSLFSTLKKNKSSAPISAGQVAPNDIVVPKGKTSFTPGPIIGELGSFGIKTSVDAGKVKIEDNKVVAKEGEEVSQKLASLLQRLGVEPMEVGLDLIAVYENQEILTKEVLDVDEEAYKKNFASAASMAFNLAFNAGYPTTDNITLLIQKAHSDSRALASEADILTDENVGALLGKASAHAEALNSSIDIKEVKEEKSEDLSDKKDEKDSKDDNKETKKSKESKKNDKKEEKKETKKETKKDTKNKEESKSKDKKEEKKDKSEDEEKKESSKS